MADRPDSKEEAPIKDEISEFIWILLILFVLFYFLSLLLSTVSSNKLLSLGWRAFTQQGLLISSSRPISSIINPINTKFVVIEKKASLYDSPGGKEILVEELGAKGTIIGGPVTVRGDKYWRVRFEDGDSGWMKEDDIANLPQSSTPMRQMATLIGTRVEVVKDTTVFASPATGEVGTKPFGSEASVIEGPLVVDGQKYWHLRFDDGLVGWVHESSLVSLNIERQPMSEARDVIGGRVAVLKGPAPIYTTIGGSLLTEVLIGVSGTVLEGPRESEGVRYWRVSFDGGVTGWVAEENLEFLKITRTPLSQVPSLLGGKVSVNVNGAPLYEKPGGRQIATKNRNTTAEIIEGPLVVDGLKYWHLRFDDGSEGWMLEDDLNYLENVEPSVLQKTISFFINLGGLLKYLLVLVSLIFAGAVFYLYRRLSDLRTKERLALYPGGVLDNVQDEKMVNPSWERVLDYIESFNESDWKLAIMEADIMLGELLDRLSLPGETIGEKLKLIEKSDFVTLENAWGAHKVRNQIAHETDFRLSQREARRVVDLYRSVFDEFEMI